MDETGHILVVEDDEGLARILAEELEADGHEVRVAGSAEEALEDMAERPPQLVLSDLRLPGATGRDLLRRVSKVPGPRPGFILITAFGTVREAVACLKAGADDFLTKPLDLEHLRLTVARTLETQELRHRLERYRKVVEADDFHGMVGRSDVMRGVFQAIQQIARGSGPVLVTGESGVGKELVARAIHEESDRHGGEFVAVNCAGVPGELLESEFFGHEAGAFTGAARARKGLFLEADGGTILLDEIGEMPPALQAKILRVLQEGRVRPVGADRDLPVDVRVLASTNRDLGSAMDEEQFREDLYYRLQTFQVEVPPLRERGDDVDLLTAHFLERFAAGLDREVTRVSTEALTLLRAYPFPGNVRELSNVMERAVTFCHGETLRPEHLPERIRRAGEASPPAEDAGIQDREGFHIGGGKILPLREVEHRYIDYALERLEGNKRRTAAVLGIGRRTLYRRLEEGDGEGA